MFLLLVHLGKLHSNTKSKIHVSFTPLNAPYLTGTVIIASPLTTTSIHTR